VPATWLGVMLEYSEELLRSQQPLLLRHGRSVLRRLLPLPLLLLLLLLLLLCHRLVAAKGSLNTAVRQNAAGISEPEEDTRPLDN
jgi:hypothetical protein